MAVFKRMGNIILILFFINLLPILDVWKMSPVFKIIAFTILGVNFIRYNIAPIRRKEDAARLRIMRNGCELITVSCVVFIIQLAVSGYSFWVIATTPVTVVSVVIAAVAGLVAVLVLLWNGILRIMLTSTQLGLIRRILLVCTWWIPIFNIILFRICCHTVRREYYFEISKIELNEQRSENEICKTQYPILLVHGIFWRDWQMFNYWGRIPRELTRNGASIYYGSQHSATSMEICAGEIKEQILRILETEHCDKVNIIAHSKGGLDARYVAGCLGMEDKVASITTIGTPHGGCLLVDRILHRTPDKMVHFIAARYNAIYRKLGDKEPDFYSGIRDLTVESCTRFNETVPDREGIVYQSVTSKMRSVFSAGFPLNAGYAMVASKEGENDGFVTVESSRHGEFLGCYSAKKTRGISHGDMIDLMRENIYGFDVCEFYVGIVRGLKEKGL